MRTARLRVWVSKGQVRRIQYEARFVFEVRSLQSRGYSVSRSMPTIAQGASRFELIRPKPQVENLTEFTDGHPEGLAIATYIVLLHSHDSRW